MTQHVQHKAEPLLQAAPHQDTVTYLQLHPADNIAVAVSDLAKGEKLNLGGQVITVIEAIPAGHKIALSNFKQEENITKFGAVIGKSSCPIKAGEHVHTHNAQTRLSGLTEYHYAPDSTPQDKLALSTAQFDGYRRENGKVGTRNEIWVISTVGCVAKYAERIARQAQNRFQGRCDDIVAFTHPFGCSQTGGDHENTRHISAALAQHPNAGGILFVGLGCENNQVQEVLEHIPEARRNRIRYFNCQEIDDELESGLTAIEELLALCEHDTREPCPLSDLVIGMKCGGSDGFSGLTANPLVGRIADTVCANEGTVLLTETPEMFGAEQILMNRAVSPAVYEKTVQLINDFKQYFIDHNQTIYDNPSPGNKAGGITTLEEKSMGAIQKGGTATVTDVLDYAEPSSVKGLNLLQAPGNDAVSSTALTASGATIILFTTGRGTPLGFPAPTIKIASNSKLAKTKKSWIDFDAGPVIQDGNMDALHDALLSSILDIASGKKKTLSELNEQREIAIWKSGVTL